MALSRPRLKHCGYQRSFYSHLLLLLAACAGVALARTDQESSIGSSSDVWAALVANIGPLLMLVGEKHIKAYFKLMWKRSYYILYAAGPIGIITAITTLIRLNGPWILKRLIGRHYESRAEVLADVTSVSSGEVGFVIRNNLLEQTISPADGETAIFYMRAQAKGNLSELADWVLAAHRITHERSDRDGARLLTRLSPYGLTVVPEYPGNWEVFAGSFQITWSNKDPGTGMYAIQFLRPCIAAVIFAPSSDQGRATHNDHDGIECTGIIEIGVGWRGVSPVLTANAGQEKVGLQILRIIIACICMLGYGGIVLANWVKTRDIQSTVLISIGLTTTILGALYTAYAVDMASKEVETEFNLQQQDGKSTMTTGFYCPDGSYGLLPACPKVMLRSTADSLRTKKDKRSFARLQSSS